MRSKPARSQGGGGGGVVHLPISTPKVTVHAIKYMYRSRILPLQGLCRSRAPFRQRREASGAPWRPGRAGATCGKSGGQSQPLSLIMWLSSMMYFPSLYFWLLSKACS